MSRTRIPIGAGNKIVWASDPYLPKQSMMGDFVGREEEMKLITAAWIAREGSLPLSPLLVGEPGVGKNRLVYEIARITGRPLYIFQGHEDVTAEDLACAVRFSDDNSRTMDYVASPLVTAMHHSAICFIDEIGKIRPRALALLVSVLDERQHIDSTLLGERVFAEPGFRFIAATNTGEVNSLPEFIRSRMRPVVKIGYPEQKEITNIIQLQCEKQQLQATQIKQLSDTFWELWNRHDEGGRQSPTPRDAIILFSLAISLSDYGSLGGTAEFRRAAMDTKTKFPLEVDLNTRTVTPDHLRLAFEELFGQQEDY